MPLAFDIPSANAALAALEQMPASALQEDWGLGFATEVYRFRREPLRAVRLLEGISREWIRYFFDETPTAFLLGEVRLLAGQENVARRDFQNGGAASIRALIPSPPATVKEARCPAAPRP